MADLSDALQSILRDPSAMEQIKELGGMLGLGGDNAQPEEAPKQPDGISSLLSSLGQKQDKAAPSADMLGTMMRLAPLLGAMNEENDSTRLLYALKPFLSEKRRRRIDQSVRLLGIMRILPLIKESGIF